MSSEIYFRPPWTCGKYNAEKHVAIMFNLLSRMNFFYEEESAEVIGCVLAAGHNGKVVVDEVSKKCNIVPKSIIKFFDELCAMGILSETEITEEVIAKYRNDCKDMDSPQTIGAHSEELSNDGVQSAYQAYADSVRDCVSLVDVMFELTYFGVKPYVRKYGSSLAFDVMLTDSIDGDKCVSKHLRLTPEQLSVVLLDEDVIQHINIDKVHDDTPVDRKFLNAPPCGAASSSFCINPNGDITPCCSFHKILGNVKQNNIKQIIEKNDFLWKWNHTTEKDYGECYFHEYCYYCNFCPGNNFNDLEEYLNGSENNCYLAKVRYNTVGRLRSGEDILHGMTIEEYINKLEIKEDILQHEYK